MRPIKFKGKDIKSGDWVEGDLLHGVGWKKDQVSILPFKQNLSYVKNCDPLDGVIIDPETLCQFTGLTDCNEKEIWEGDVVNGPTDKQRYEIRFDGLEFYFMHCWLKDYAGKSVRWGLLSRGIEVFNEYKVPLCVIGNRFDNPELLEVQP